MTSHTIPSRSRIDSSDRRERTLSIVAAVLGIVMFALGFLRWLEVGSGDTQQEYSGFAWAMPTTAVIGFSLAAGIIAFLGASDARRGRGVPSAIPAGLAATSLLLAAGIYLGRDGISPDSGADVGVEIGLVLALITALVQTIVLVMGLVSRWDQDERDTLGRTGQAI